MTVPSEQAEAASPSARRLSRPNWLDLRVVVGVVLVLGSVYAGARIVAAADDRVPVVAVRSALGSGTQLAGDQLVIVRVAMDRAERALYVSVPTDAVGHRLVRDVDAGEFLALSALQTVRDTTTLVIPLARDAAPSFAAGQRVTIWLTAPTCGTHVLLSDATVQSAHRADAGSFDDAGGQSIIVSVDSGLALTVVTALSIDRVSLRAGRIDGTNAIAPPTPFDVANCAGGSS